MFSYAQENSITINDSIIHFENLPLNNGLAYENKYWNTTDSNKQYFINEYKNGSIFYNGNLYTNVKLKFDILENQILYKPKFNVLSEIVLLNDLVDYFIIDQKKFVKIIFDNKINYFEEIKINGNNFLSIKHLKTNKIDLTSGEKKFTFYNDLEIYYVSNNTYNLIKNKKSLYPLFPDKKKEIQNFFEKNKPLFESNSILFYTRLLNEITTTKWRII